MADLDALFNDSNKIIKPIHADTAITLKRRKLTLAQ